jgi:hypothetical protein
MGHPGGRRRVASGRGRVATTTAAMGAEALDADLRPFARPEVPDTFSEAASLRE